MSVLLDLFVVYFFKRPAVSLLVRSDRAELALVRRQGGARRRSRGLAHRSRAGPAIAEALMIARLDTFRGYRHPKFHIVQRRRWAIVSGVVIAVCLLGLFWRGLNYSIDFTGGR